MQNTSYRWFNANNTLLHCVSCHDDVIKWRHFPRYWPFVRGIHRSPVNSPHKGQWRGALMFSLVCVWINGWVNNREAGDLRRHCAHCDVIVMCIKPSITNPLVTDSYICLVFIKTVSASGTQQISYGHKIDVDTIDVDTISTHWDHGTIPPV